MSNEQKVRIEKLVRDSFKAGRGVEEIQKEWRPVFGSLIDQVLDEVRNDLNLVYTLADPKAILARNLQAETYRWYAGPGVHSERWFSAMRATAR